VPIIKIYKELQDVVKFFLKNRLSRIVSLGSIVSGNEKCITIKKKINHRGTEIDTECTEEKNELRKMINEEKISFVICLFSLIKNSFVGFVNFVVKLNMY